MMAKGGESLVRTVLVALVAAVSLCAVAWGTAALSADASRERSYHELAEQVAPEDNEAGVDWDALRSQNADVCAWLEVDGTSVATPVVAASGDDPDHWVYRDLWGNASDTGTPYLDYRCSADGAALVVYGHRTLYASYLFHDLAGVYEQEAFDTLGTASWETPDAGETSFSPLCSASVDKADERWQRFAFTGEVEMREWLTWACDNASAVSADRENLVEDAGRVLVLVTCNGRPFYPTTRTVTVYVSERAIS